MVVFLGESRRRPSGGFPTRWRRGDYRTIDDDGMAAMKTALDR
jgi:hypothetical protein